MLHLKAWGVWVKISVHRLLQRGCKKFDVKQGTKTLAVKTTGKAEHFWVFYFPFQQTFFTLCWTFLPLTGRKLNLLSLSINVHWGKGLKLHFHLRVHALQPFKGPFLPTYFIKYKFLQILYHIIRTITCEVWQQTEKKHRTEYLTSLRNNKQVYTHSLPTREAHLFNGEKQKYSFCVQSKDQKTLMCKILQN